MDNFTLTEAKYESDMKRGSDQLRNEVIYALIDINKRMNLEKKAARDLRRKTPESSVKTLPSSAPLGDSLGASR